MALGLSELKHLIFQVFATQILLTFYLFCVLQFPYTKFAFGAPSFFFKIIKVFDVFFYRYYVSLGPFALSNLVQEKEWRDGVCVCVWVCM